MTRENTITRALAIKRHCRECVGDSPKEVTLCSIHDCHLWPFRFGCSVDAKAYQKRMDRAKKKKKCPEEPSNGQNGEGL